MNIIRAIEIVSLKNVLDPDGDYKIRKIIRWYSKTFHTPLHIAEDLPLDDILIAYFESTYEEMELEELEKFKVLLLETEEERLLRLKAEDEDELSAKQFLETAKEAEESRHKKGSKNDKILSSSMKGREPVLGDGIRKNAPKDDIRIEFVDDNLLDEGDESSIGAVNKKTEW